MSDHGRSSTRQPAWVMRHRGDLFVFVDASVADVSRPLRIEESGVATCRYCMGVHILRYPNSWLVCSNPRCVPPPHELPETHLLWDADDRAYLIISAHTMGGPDAVLDIMGAGQWLT